MSNKKRAKLMALFTDNLADGRKSASSGLQKTKKGFKKNCCKERKENGGTEPERPAQNVKEKTHRARSDKAKNGEGSRGGGTGR